MKKTLSFFFDETLANFNSTSRNDEVLHAGHDSMCQYLLAVCIGPK